MDASSSGWHTAAVSNVVNLNRFRKKKKREAEVKQAEVNRIRHGRTKAERERELVERFRAARTIDGHRLERDAEDLSRTAPEAPADEDA